MAFFKQNEASDFVVEILFSSHDRGFHFRGCDFPRRNLTLHSSCPRVWHLRQAVENIEVKINISRQWEF